MTPEQIERDIADLSNLPTLPAVVKILTSMVEDENVSAGDIGTVLQRDQVLSAKILRLVNSPVYGFPGRISSVTHALVLLGFNVVKGLVLGTAVFDTLGKDARGLWEHSLGTAVLSRRLARELDRRETEEIMVAGLLHDLGKVVLSFLAPEEFRRACELAAARRCHIAQAEREVFGVDHTRVGMWVAASWHLPARLSEALAYHHKPGRAKRFTDAAAVVHLADILARGMDYGYPGDPTMPPLDHEAYQTLGITFEQLDRVLIDAERDFATGVDLLNLGNEGNRA
ncbi:MAG: HDOD domain-containing protein [Candidatus Hydrogenedentota bacterium]